MCQYHFKHQIQVRFADLDTQWHVNNVRYLTYLEDARYAYITSLGIFDGRSFRDLPLILAKTTIEYLAPIHPGEHAVVHVRVLRLGSKSITFQFKIESTPQGTCAAKAEVILVAYDYHRQESIPIPTKWRNAIANFEGIAPYSEK